MTVISSAGLFGVKRYGVHVNGYTVGKDGEVSMWLARRSATKQTYPGLLDNVVRGVGRVGIESRTTSSKHCQAARSRVMFKWSH